METDATLQSLVQSLHERGSDPAIVSFGTKKPETWSYEKLAETIFRLAAGLQQAGISRGDPVAIIGPNSPAWIIAYFGIVSAGATAVPIDNLLGNSEIVGQLDAVDVRWAFVSREHFAGLKKIAHKPKTRFVLLDEKKSGTKTLGWQSLLTKKAQPPSQANEDETVSLLFTSGTTGPPKIVPLTHRNFLSNVTAIKDASLAGPGDRVLLPLPLHHAYPFTVGLLGVLTNGATLLLPAGATGPALAQALKEGKATVMLAVPRLLEALVETIETRIAMQGKVAKAMFNRLLSLSIGVRRAFGIRIGRTLFRRLHEEFAPDLRLIGSGGAKLESEIAWKLEGLGWQVLSGYGLTETAPMLTFNVPKKSRLGTAGRPIPGVEIRIETTPGSAQGEILVRGPGVFSGYPNNPKATKAAFNADGWFRTGDLGFLDNDGFLHIVGRAKEVIVLASGENIFPEDVEDVYEQPSLFQEAAVLEQKGALVGLFVPDFDAFRKQGAGRANVLVREAIEKVSRNLPQYQRLSDYRLIHDSLPRTHLGKLKRHQLPLLWQRAIQKVAVPKVKLSEADRKLISQPPTGNAWEWLEQRFKGKPLTLDTSFQLDLGLDSLAWVALTLELEDRFKISLTDRDISQIITVRDLLNKVAKAGKAGKEQPSVEAALTQDQLKWLKPPGPIKRATFFFLYGLSWLVMRLFFRLRAKGIENLPREGALLIAPRHTSTLDPVALIAALPLRLVRRIYWAGWAPHLFSSWWRRYLSHGAKVFPVDPNRYPMATLAFGLKILERGDPLVWFPEGERARTPEILPFRTGIGVVLRETGAPALPVLITGTLEAMPRDTYMPRLYRISVVFGKPRTVKELLTSGKGKTPEVKIADGLRKSLLALKKSGVS